MKLLREKYKTLEGARKRAAFENGIARSEYEKGYKAHVYVYTHVKSDDGLWRVSRSKGPLSWQTQRAEPDAYHCSECGHRGHGGWNCLQCGAVLR